MLSVVQYSNVFGSDLLGKGCLCAKENKLIYSMEQMSSDGISSCEMEQKQTYTMKNDFVFIERSCNEYKLCQTKYPQSLIAT